MKGELVKCGWWSTNEFSIELIVTNSLTSSWWKDYNQLWIQHGIVKKTVWQSTNELDMKLVVINSLIPSHSIILIESYFQFHWRDSKFCPIHSHVLGHSIVLPQHDSSDKLQMSLLVE